MLSRLVSMVRSICRILSTCSLAIFGCKCLCEITIRKSLIRGVIEGLAELLGWLLNGYQAIIFS